MLGVRKIGNKNDAKLDHLSVKPVVLGYTLVPCHMVSPFLKKPPCWVPWLATPPEKDNVANQISSTIPNEV